MDKYKNMPHSQRLKLCSSFIFGMERPSLFMSEGGARAYSYLLTSEYDAWDLVTARTSKIADPLYRAVRYKVNQLERIRKMDLRPDICMNSLISTLGIPERSMLENLGYDRRSCPEQRELKEQLDSYLNYAIGKTNEVLRSAGY